MIGNPNHSNISNNINSGLSNTISGQIAKVKPRKQRTNSSIINLSKDLNLDFSNSVNRETMIVQTQNQQSSLNNADLSSNINGRKRANQQTNKIYKFNQNTNMMASNKLV